MDYSKFTDLVRALHQHGVDYVLIGAAAMGVHGVVRATEDVDMFVRPTPQNIERLKQALRSVWDDPAIDEISSDDLCGDYPAVRYGPPDDSLPLDILTHLGEAFHYADLESETREVDGIPVHVASVSTLCRMKRGTVRFKDRLDVEAMRERFGTEVD